MNKRARYFAATFGPLLLLCLITLGGLLYVETERQKASIQDNESRLVTLTAKVIRDRLSGAQQDLIYLSQQKLLNDFINGRRQLLDELARDYARYSRQSEVYDQIRLIAANGDEMLRINHRGDDVEVVAPAGLRNKKDRYYFTATMAQPAGQVYVSRFDLNVEDGVVEEPRIPMIRFGLPLFDATGKRWGILILNYAGKRLLERMDQIAASSNGAVWLVNREGYWLAGPDPGDEWAFMYPDRVGQRLPLRAPAVWRSLQDAPAGHFEQDGALYSHVHLCGTRGCADDPQPHATHSITMPFEAPGFPWAVVSRVPVTAFGLGMLTPLVRGMLPLVLLLAAIATIAGILTWRLARSVDTLRNNETELRRSRVLLDAFIDNNPAALFIKDLAGRYLFANRACRDMLGCGDDPATGTDDTTHFPPEVATEIRAQEQSTVQDDMPTEYEISVSAKDNEAHYRTLNFPLHDEAGAVYAVGGIATDVAGKVRAEQALVQSEQRFGDLLEAAPDAIVIAAADGRIVLVNRQTEKLFGYDREQLLAMTVEDLVPQELRERHKTARASYLEDPVTRSMGASRELHGVRRGGDSFPIEVSLSPAGTDRGILIICTIRDISDRRQLEDQFRQSQKMEAIGQLTGGMAHDFNNLLGVVIGNLDLLERMVADDDQQLRRVQTAQKAALRGADLTRRMLAVARRQSLRPEPTAVNEIITELAEMLPRTLGADVEVETRLAGDLPAVLIDRSGFENALLNLAINARDAMPEGGKLYIRTEIARLGEDYLAVRNGDIPAGTYVRISVTDNGAGMAPEILDRAFEPFFTTKERGKGTGLGLAMIYGFIKQSQGHIRVYSEIGEGTTVNIYLPATAQTSPAIPPAGPATVHGDAGSHKKILVVDDEVELLEIAVTYLEELGYTAYPATDGRSALELLDRHPDIDLLLTDVIMPGGMNGVALARAVRERLPAVHILYTSGFPSDALADKAGVRIDAPVVTKPYRKDELARQLGIVLGNALEE